MNFKDHSELQGQHAFLGASQHHWINYDDIKLEEVYRNELAKQLGTELHDIASKNIKYGIKLQGHKKTLSAFVNDAIGYRMRSEVVLFYSYNCFGTADAISFENNLLRIHDLKTGVKPAHFEQLRIYAALFCLEYGYQPKDIRMELRIYQSDDIRIEIPDPEEIANIMRIIVNFDKKIDSIKKEDI